MLRVHVGALAGILVVRRRAFHYLHFKLQGQLFGRIAGGIVASLVFQLAAQHVFAGHDVGQRPHHNRQGG